jgi:hypothetical protein
MSAGAEGLILLRLSAGHAQEFRAAVEKHFGCKQAVWNIGSPKAEFFASSAFSIGRQDLDDAGAAVGEQGMAEHARLAGCLLLSSYVGE